jgi:hypothetical protein
MYMKLVGSSMTSNSDIAAVVESVKTRIKSTHIKGLDMHFPHGKQHFFSIFYV